MKLRRLSDQRGTLLLELVLVAAVLALVGLAVYQANNRSQSASTKEAQTAPKTVSGLASDAGDALVKDAAAEASLSEADSSAVDAASQAASDVTDLGDPGNAVNF